MTENETAAQAAPAPRRRRSSTSVSTRPPVHKGEQEDGQASAEPSRQEAQGPAGAPEAAAGAPQQLADPMAADGPAQAADAGNAPAPDQAPAQTLAPDQAASVPAEAASAAAPEAPARRRSSPAPAEAASVLVSDAVTAVGDAPCAEAAASAEAPAPAISAASAPATSEEGAGDSAAAAPSNGSAGGRRSSGSSSGNRRSGGSSNSSNGSAANNQNGGSSNSRRSNNGGSNASNAQKGSSAQKQSNGRQQQNQGNRQNQGQGQNQNQNQNRNQNQGGQNQSQGGQSQNNQNHRRQRRQHSSQGTREVQPSVSHEELSKLKVAELREKAVELEVNATGLRKAELVDAVYAASVKAEGFVQVEGILDILADGYGFLRTQGYLPSESDCYVGLSLIKRNGLRKGDYIVGQTRPARENEKYAAIQKVVTVNGIPAEECTNRVKFGDLTPVYPDEMLKMEHGKNSITARVIDLVSPIGKGQRGLIVSPPKAGKTTILKDIAASISANNPEVHLMCLLVDERPEEVTDMERSIKGEVISSTFDMPTENHIAVAELVIERAKRLVECGEDVVILLDSITRLARAYNLAQPASGRILSGGVDSTALYPPKRFLGAARNIEGGGSLTILASALIDTGSKMDEVIFEEFKGTGNMELRLDRDLADRRVFPAIDPVASGTRKEELLLDPQEAPLIWAVRRILANMNSTERAMDMLIKSLKQTETNQEFLLRTAKKAQHSKGDVFEI